MHTLPEIWAVECDRVREESFLKRGEPARATSHRSGQRSGKTRAKYPEGGHVRGAEGSIRCIGQCAGRPPILLQSKRQLRQPVSAWQHPLHSHSTGHGTEGSYRDRLSNRGRREKKPPISEGILYRARRLHKTRKEAAVHQNLR